MTIVQIGCNDGKDHVLDFYRANEKLMVAKMSDGSLVDAKPKTNALLRGGQE